MAKIVFCLFCVATLMQSFAVNAHKAHTQAPPLITQTELASVVSRAMEKFYTPGVAVAVVHQGEIAHLAGFGQRHIQDELPVNAFTYFRLASVSKAFTAATVALLVQDGKLNWDDKVITHLPEFKLMSRQVTREFTVLDLLTHRSGLVGGAGDSMIWPEPSGFSRQEVIHNLRYLTPKFNHRETFAYSNVLYITAAELVARVAGMPWEQFIDERLFTPLDMDCYAGEVPSIVLKNVAHPYGHSDERGIYPIVRNAITGPGQMSAAAGGIVCHAEAMSKWLALWLNNGKAPNGAVVIDAQQLDFMWQAHMPLNVPPTAKYLHQTHFRAYGAGWRKQNVFGYEMFSHTGTLSGYQAFAAIIPEFELGVIVLNNGSNYGARASIMHSIIKSVMPEAPDMDYVNYYVGHLKRAEKRWLKRYGTPPQGSGTVLLPHSEYLGEYRDTWFGAMFITKNDHGELRLVSQRKRHLTGTLEPFDTHSWVVRWDNQNAASDAFLHFDTDGASRIIGFSMHPFQTEQENDHAYRDMYFTVTKNTSQNTKTRMKSHAVRDNITSK